MTAESAAADRVLAVLAVAARLSDRDDPLGAEARAGVEALGVLSPAGVDLALTRHIERVEDTDLDAVLASVRHASRCWVVASAHVCVAPVRAIALGFAASEQVFVKPSRRDPVVARLLVRELAAAGLGVSEVPAVAPVAGDDVHAYGSDETLRAIESGLPSGVGLVGHGTGFGIAAVGAEADLAAAAAALADDVVVFDQAGCLSPRICLVEGDAERGAGFAAALSGALDVRGLRVPRGPLGAGDRATLQEYERTMLALGDLRRGPQHLVGLEHSPTAPLVGPAMRVVTVLSYPAADAARSALAPMARLVTAVGGAPSPFVDALRAALPRARASALGEMQRPRFDGPVDRRHGA